MTEIAQPFAISQPAISRHLEVPGRAGLISRRRDAQRRPCRLEVEHLGEAAAWIDQYRDRWEQNFARLDDLLDGMKSD